MAVISEGAVCFMGNIAAHEPRRDASDRMIYVPMAPGKYVTTVALPAHKTVHQLFTEITSAGGIWPHWSSEPPAWVECINCDLLAQMLADFYDCPIGRPVDMEGWVT